MANKVTIEVEALLVDQVSGKTKYVISGLDGIGKAAEEAQRDLDKLGKKKIHPIIDADNNKLLQKLRDSDNKAAKLAGKTFTTTLKVLDKGTSIVNKLESGLKRVVGKTWTTLVKIKDYATAPLRKLRDMVFNMKNLVLTITASLAIKKFVLDPINLADAYSSTKIGFSTLLGDEQGQAMMDAMDDFAKKTPFKTSGVISNAQKMMAYGWDPERILEDMETIGDAAAATGKMDQGLEAIVYALSEIRSKGKLSTQELNQLAGAGIKAKAYLAEGLGYGTSDAGMAKLAKDLESGVIGANQAIDLILQGMQEFDGMMDRTANETVEGLKSQIEDAFEINIFRRWGQGLQDGAKRGMGSIVELLDSASEGLAGLGDMLYEVGEKASNWLADKLEGAVELITALSRTEQFKNADFGGKIKILWDNVVANPVKDWWEGGGREKVVETATNVGTSIGKAIIEGIKIAWDAMPWWGKLLVGTYGGAKTLSGISSLAGGVASFFGSRGAIGAGNAVTGASGLLGAIGRTGVSGVGASGMLGFLANTGYKVLGGTSALSVGGGMAALAGGATIAGLGAGIYTAGSGIGDLYSGYKNNDATAKKSGWWKVGGAAGGAAAGAAIGTALGGPLLGTAIGALIGSGIGWLGSSQAKKAAVDNAVATGSLKELAMSESEAAEEAAKLLIQNEKLAKESLAEHFGDVKLSAEEMQQAIRSVIGDKFFEETAAATEAIEAMNTSFAAVEAQSSSLKKNLWMATLKKDTKLTKDEIAALKSNVDSFSKSTKNYVTDAQYAAEESITAILGNSEQAKKLIESNNEYYDKQGKELETLSEKLDDEINKALSENSEGGAIITVNEKASIDKIRSQMAEIVRKLQEEDYQAEINILKAKYAGDLTPEGFSDLMTGAAEQNKALAETYWDGFGRASIGKSEEEIEILRQGVLDKLSTLWSNTGDLGINTLREQYSEELGILGQDIGTMLEKNTPEEIMNAVNNMDDDTRAAIGKMMEFMQPTTDEVEKLVKSYEDAGLKVPEALTSYLERAEFYEALGKGPEAVEQYFKDKEIDIDPKISIKNPNVDLVSTKEFLQNLEIDGHLDVAWTYDEFDDEWITPDGQYSFTTTGLVEAGWVYNEFEKKWISPDGRYSFSTNADVNVDFDNNKFDGSKSNMGVDDRYRFNTNTSVMSTWSVAKFSPTMSTFGIRSSYTFTPTINLSPKLGDTPAWQSALSGGSARGNIWYPAGSNAKGFAAGGLVRGGARLIKVAEEGSPEMIIPLSSQRRERALKLWAKAGEMMNVPGFARGGLTRGGADEGIRFHRYGADDSASGRTVQVDVGGITLEIHVNGTDAQSIAEAIKAQVADIAEDVAGVMAEALSAQFENTPVRGGVA